MGKTTLFSPIAINGLYLPNRVIMSPMFTNSAAPEGFGTSVMLVSETPVDLIKNSEGSCLKPSLTLEGGMPTGDIVYDLVMHLTIKYHVGLF